MMIMVLNDDAEKPTGKLGNIFAWHSESGKHSISKITPIYVHYSLIFSSFYARALMRSIASDVRVLSPNVVNSIKVDWMRSNNIVI